MRMHFIMPALLSLGLALGACANGADGPQGPKGVTGDAGATGPKGDQGDQGATGDKGPTGDQGATGDAGANGVDGVCDGSDPLVITDVSGVPTRMFTQDTSPKFTVAVARESGGTVGDYDVTVVTNGYPADMGTAANEFTVTPLSAGIWTYAVVVTDGCTVASKSFDLNVVDFEADIAVVNLATELGEAYLAVPEAGVLGLIGAPESTGYFHDTGIKSVEFLFLDDTGAELATTGPLELAYNEVYTVVVTDDGNGGVVGSLLKDDLSEATAGKSRTMFFHAAPGAGVVDVTDGAGTVWFNDVAERSLSTEAPELDVDTAYTVGLDVGGDGSDDFVYDVTLDVTGDGGFSQIFAYNQDGQPALFVRSVDVTSLNEVAEIVRAPVMYDVSVGSGSLAEPAAPYDPAMVIDSTHADIENTINVSESCTITDVAIGVDITHAYRGDLTLDIVGPDDTTVRLRAYEFDSTDDFVGMFFDGAVDSASEFAPDEALSAFAGKSATGAWKLVINDHYPSSDNGQFNGWSVNFFCE